MSLRDIVCLDAMPEMQGQRGNKEGVLWKNERTDNEWTLQCLLLARV